MTHDDDDDDDEDVVVPDVMNESGVEGLVSPERRLRLWGAPIPLLSLPHV
jgi:hypothetical protein